MSDARFNVGAVLATLGLAVFAATILTIEHVPTYQAMTIVTLITGFASLLIAQVRTASTQVQATARMAESAERLRTEVDTRSKEARQSTANVEQHLAAGQHEIQAELIAQRGAMLELTATALRRVADLTGDPADVAAADHAARQRDKLNRTLQVQADRAAGTRPPVMPPADPGASAPPGVPT